MTRFEKIINAYNSYKKSPSVKNFTTVSNEVVIEVMDLNERSLFSKASLFENDTFYEKIFSKPKNVDEFFIEKTIIEKLIFDGNKKINSKNLSDLERSTYRFELKFLNNQYQNIKNLCNKYKKTINNTIKKSYLDKLQKDFVY